MMFAGLVIEAGEWQGPVVAVLAMAFLLSWWSYRRHHLNPGPRWLGISLRALGATILLLCLLEPTWTSQRAVPGANWFAVLADNSQGMQIHDPDAKVSRGEEMKALLTDTSDNWQDRLAENFQVRRYLFDSRLQSVRDYTTLDFTGNASAMVSSLESVRERFQGLPLAGVLMFTDGNATDFIEGLIDYPNLPPIYPVVMGGDKPVKDLSISRVGVTQTAFEDAPVTITADITANGFDGRDIEVSLVPVELTEGSAVTNLTSVLARRDTQRVKADRDTLGFRFQIQPAGGTIHFYELKVREADSRAAGDTNAPVASAGEATLVNNQRLVLVDRGAGPYRILYVSGRPNWEYKFLKRSLEEDEQLRLVGLIRLAKRAPKYEFRGRDSGASNPLFRGFGDETIEETERYDQPVLVRLNTRDESELRGGFPRSADELFPYHAVILDDLESAFFKPDQLALLEKFVTERGGGLLMLGGQESFKEGGYDRTPVGNMLPVYLRDLQPFGQTAGGPLFDLRLSLTREGLLQPWARTRNTEAAEQARLAEVPGFRVLNDVSGIKPGASVIAKVTDSGGGEHPAIVAQRFGKGRTGAMLLGDFWRSGRHSAEQNEDMEKAWRQICRWLVTDAQDRLSISTRSHPEQPGAVLLTTRVRNPEYLPMDNASVKIQVTRVVGDASTNQLTRVELTGEPVPSDPGLFTATYMQHGSGGYLAEAIVQDDAGVEIGRVKTGWVSEPSADEFRSLTPNRTLLEQIARQTGGEVVRQDDLAGFVEKLPSLKAPMMESYSQPLWHNPWVFLIAMGCFVAEWAMRRRKGLA